LLGWLYGAEWKELFDSVNLISSVASFTVLRSGHQVQTAAVLVCLSAACCWDGCWAMIGKVEP